MNYSDIKRNIRKAVKLLPENLNKKEKREILLKAGLISLLMNKYNCIFDEFKVPVSFNSIICCFYKEEVSLDYEEEKASLYYEFYKDLVDILNCEDEEYLALMVAFSFDEEEKRKGGITYTPKEIREYILSLYEFDRTKKIMDPSCGAGLFLLDCYDKLKEYYDDKDSFKIHKAILDNNIFGVEKDELSALFCRILLAFKCDKFYLSSNISADDFLFKEENKRFDVIVMNPPYMGNKQLNKEYKALLKNKFCTYYEKGDIYYCFIEKGYDYLKDGGTFLIITKRYFMESLYGDRLRKFIKENFRIEFIYDFYGLRPFENAGVDPVIVKLKKENTKTNKIEILKGNKKFLFNQDELSFSPWCIISEEDKNVVAQINNKTSICLEDISDTFQGIITGFDKAFVVDESFEPKILSECGLKWIKGKDLTKKTISDKYLLYTNDKEEVQIKNTIEYLKQYKPRLEKRRECVFGTRNWYHLQWARDKELFEREKIIFPYKSEKNNFKVDKKGYFFSADIYGLVLNEEINIPLEKLCFILNSSLYEFYFKTYAKKMGKNLYEYYPNTVSKLRLPCIEDINKINTENDLYDYFEIKKADIVKKLD